MKRWLIGLAVFSLGSASLLAATLDWNAEPLRKVKLETVAFRGWIPEGTEPLHGTLVLIPGRHGDGRGMADDARWQKLATSLGFAILGCQFTNGDPGLYQQDAQKEVADAINDAVDELAKQSGHPELAKAPLAFWGTSAGSNVSSRYCQYHPDRVAAFASSKGTWGPGGNQPKAASEIPMFFAIGAKDKAEWVATSTDNFKKDMGSQSPWTLALHPAEGHGVGASLDVAIPFLDATIKSRLGLGGAATDPASPFKSQLPSIGSSSSGSNASTKLQKISLKSGWLGNPETYDIAPYEKYQGTKSKAIWLPDESTATAWQSYLRS